MPPLPPYPGVLRWRFLFDIGTDINAAVNLHLTYSGTTPSATTLNTMAQTAYTAMASTMAGQLSPDRSFEGIQIQDLSSSTGAFGEYLHTTVGTRGGGTLSASECALMNIPIARRYRGGKPRAYWPWGTDTDLATPQTWNSAALTAFEGAAIGILSAVGSSGTGGTVVGSLCSISYYSGFTPVTNPVTGRTRDVPKVRTAALAPDIAVTFSFNPHVASQRRRNLIRS